MCYAISDAIPGDPGIQRPFFLIPNSMIGGVSIPGFGIGKFHQNCTFWSVNDTNNNFSCLVNKIFPAL